MTDAVYYLKIVSTFSVLLPLFLGIGLGMHRHRPYPLFLVFLFFGFLIDLTGWYMFITNNTQGNWYYRYAYGLVEPLFYFWWIGYFSQSRVVVQINQDFHGTQFYVLAGDHFLSACFFILLHFHVSCFGIFCRVPCFGNHREQEVIPIAAIFLDRFWDILLPPLHILYKGTNQRTRCPRVVVYPKSCQHHHQYHLRRWVFGFAGMSLRLLTWGVKLYPIPDCDDSL
jgi:hypothetical protein